jgi:hypothetical protein
MVSKMTTTVVVVVVTTTVMMSLLFVQEGPPSSCCPELIRMFRDDTHLQAFLAGLDGSNVAGNTTTNDDEVLGLSLSLGSI